MNNKRVTHQHTDRGFVQEEATCVWATKWSDLGPCDQVCESIPVAGVKDIKGGVVWMSLN